MKLLDSRFILISGLSLAISLNEPSPASAAGPAKRKVANLAQSPLDLNSTPVPITPPPAPNWSPTPLVPTPNGQDPDLPSQSSGAPPVTTVPMPLGTKPNLAPANRAPLGFHYGEQDQFQLRTNPPPRSPSTSPAPQPAQQLPPNAIAMPLNPESGDPGSPDVVADRFGYAPPPGTLGQTYKRRSRLLEDAKHPRLGVVEVHVPEDVDVTAVGLKTKWTGKVWRLESDPLLPGVPHIYEIKASWGEGTEPHYRTVRLIMGRIVDLDF